MEAGNGSKVAIYWEGNEPGQDARLTYAELLDRVCQVPPFLSWLTIINTITTTFTNVFMLSFRQLANYLKDIGVRKGDAVVVYLPMLMELPITMLACARIGAVHSVFPPLKFC